MARVILAPRWGATDEDDWYPWLRRELGEVSVARLLPNPGAPEIDACVIELERLVGDDRDAVLVGHSVGCQIVLRYLDKQGHRMPHVLCVAGWFWIDEPWPTILPWIETPIDWARVRHAAGQVRVLLSDDDPFTSDYQSNAAAWRERLGAQVEIQPGARHFNRVEEPFVLASLVQSARSSVTGK